MLGIKTKIMAALREAFPSTAGFTGADGRVWLAGAIDRGPSIAQFFCGAETRPVEGGRTHRSRVIGRLTKDATEGAVQILFSAHDAPLFLDPEGRAIIAPLRIALRKTLPKNAAALMADIKTSTTQEDLRRIRKAGFTFRVTKDPADARLFHARYHTPLVNHRFPEDGATMSLDGLLANVSRGGELVCADLDGEWVAGLYNWATPDEYSMGPLGIRDADEAIRHKRAVSGLLVASLERAVALNCPAANLGYSVPFLGKGPIWFKAKWGCTLEVQTSSPNMQMFLDLRHAQVRKVLAESPIIHRDGPDLVVAAWLLPGEAALSTLIREAGRYPGIARWYVLGDPQTIAVAEPALSNDRITPLRINLETAAPLWLGQVIRGCAKAGPKVLQAGSGTSAADFEGQTFALSPTGTSS